MGLGKRGRWNVYLPGRHRKGNVHFISRLSLFSPEHSLKNAVGRSDNQGCQRLISGMQ